jgi:hypothetical protein
MRLKSSAFGFLALAASALMSAPAMAEDYLSMNLGAYNALRDGNSDTQFGLEYRMSAFQYNLRPIFGGFVTDEGALYGYAGVNWDIELLPKQLFLIPNFAVGAYHQGDGKDLGGAIEFRSGVELAYQFQNNHQLGLAVNHLSNASLYDRNPGVETVMVTYSVPLNSFGGLIGGQ